MLQKYNIIASEADMPPRHIVGGPVLSDLYESMLDSVKEIICTDGAQHFAISFDAWANQHQKLNYITFKLHYITSG